MFLKKEELKYAGSAVVLYELSGLQRVEYLEFISVRSADFDSATAGVEESVRRLAFLQMGVDINAWLVSRSLWNEKQEGDVDATYQSVRRTWSYDALGQGADQVLAMSGMALAIPERDPDDTEPVDADPSLNKEPDSPEKF